MNSNFLIFSSSMKKERMNTFSSFYLHVACGSACLITCVPNELIINWPLLVLSNYYQTAFQRKNSLFWGHTPCHVSVGPALSETKPPSICSPAHFSAPQDTSEFIFGNVLYALANSGSILHKESGWNLIERSVIHLLLSSLPFLFDQLQIRLALEIAYAGNVALDVRFCQCLS